MTCRACRHGWCWLCMGDAVAHGWADNNMRGGHPPQCNSMDDVRRLGRMEFVYDEAAAAAGLEKELKDIEPHKKKYRY